MSITGRKSLAVVLSLGMAVFFAWGFMSHRNHLFPYSAIVAIKNSLAITDGPGQQKEDLFSQIRSVPYVMGKRSNSRKDGVVRHDRKASFEGYNLYNSRPLNEAVLMDNDGNVVHKWHDGGSDSWLHIEMDSDGNLYAIDLDRQLVKLDKDSNVVWRYKCACHHDISLGDDGRVYVLTYREEMRPRLNPDTPTIVDYITVLDKDGALIKEICMLDVFMDSDYSMLLPVVNKEAPHRSATQAIQGIDILHTNSIEVFDGSVAHISPALFRKGNILFSCRTNSFIGIYDPDKDSIVWGWGPATLQYQHHPSLLDNGDILIFDNRTDRSRVVELSVADNIIEWEYGTGKNEKFFSLTRGGAQRLPNGNSLITISDEGMVIEVTPSGQVVWTFINPHTYKNKKGQDERGAIYRMMRFPKDAVSFLD